MKRRHVECPDCKTVHWPISRALAEASVKTNNRHYDAVVDSNLGPRPNRKDISDYEHCVECGAHYTKFVAVKRAIKGERDRQIIESGEA